jgi:hypothetical protein
VLAGLVLLGTVLSSALIARGRFLRQWREADDTLSAARLAEPLLEEWMSMPAGTAPVPGEGPMPGSPQLRWRTMWLRNPAASRVGARLARVEVYPAGDASGIRLAVEFLLRAPPATTQEAAP